MHDGFSIITPAYNAQATLAEAVQSVIAQTEQNWEMIIVADDQANYEAVLADMGIRDPRLRFLTTGVVGSGSSHTRNIGLEAARHRFGVILDADDFLAPDKLERARPHLNQHSIVSSALRVTTADGQFLRDVANGDDKVLTAASYKFTNISMDSMLIYDRQKCDPRYDPSFPSLTDIEFALRLFAISETCFHLGTPLHFYRKLPQSISNKPGASAQYIAVKERLLALLVDPTYYPLAREEDRAGMIAFWRISLEAERLYGARLATAPGLLFEDHLTPMLKAASTSF